MNTEISNTNIFIKLYNLCCRIADRFTGANEGDSPIKPTNKIMSGDRIDICTLFRRIFVYTPLIIVAYCAFYALLYATTIQMINEFGMVISLIGYFFYILLVASIVGLFYFKGWYQEYVSKRSKSNEPNVARVWYDSVKNKTCVMFNVR